jgi:hypothetical protein
VSACSSAGFAGATDASGGRIRQGGGAPLRLSRPEFSKIMRDMNARVRAEMDAKSKKH